MAEWFDTALLAATARALPQVSFVIIGPGSTRLTELADFRNVYLLGTRPYAVIPAYYQHAAVGLIPFTRAGHAAFVDSINPLKLYEYTACQASRHIGTAMDHWAVATLVAGSDWLD